MLGKDMHPRIHRVLIRSYNLLPYDIDRELFLHIACFFIGEDMDYVVKILEPDYLAISRIKILTMRCLLSISPNKKLLMHPLLQEMGRTIVHQESPKDPAIRSRVWCNKESYDLLSKGKGSKTIEGLALDMKVLREGKYALKASIFRTDSLKNMNELKLLQLKYVELAGSYEDFSENLRWICWLGSHLRTIPRDLYLGNLVALDMSYSWLEIFELPMVLQSLQVLNLKDSHNLRSIRNFSLLPNLETLILWNCHNLSYVCETIEGLKNLLLLNMIGCENFCKISMKMTNFSLPHTVQRLFLKDCYIECTDSFPLRFSARPLLQYLSLGNSLFEFLPDYSHLKSLRVLDLTLCFRLKQLLCLPSTLAELYVYYCVSLEKITFQSCQFTLQEFGYEGCTSFCESEGFIKLMPLAKLDEADLGHMKWLKEYQNHEVCLVGDDELTTGRKRQLQGFHMGEHPTMRSKMHTKPRIVRCPRCENVLPEPTDIYVYKCGGCGALLQVKKRTKPISQTDTDITSQTATDTDITSPTLTYTDISSPSLTYADISSPTLTYTNISSQIPPYFDLTSTTLPDIDINNLTLTDTDITKPGI